MKNERSPEAELAALRLAAEQRDWNACREAAKRLLLRLPANRALELTRVQVARRLPNFEQHHPTATWPRKHLESLGRTESVGEQAWPESEDDFPGPGANNFISAVEALWQAGRLASQDRQRVEALVNALSDAVLAEMLEAWGRQHPEEWERWYGLGRTGNDELTVTRMQVHLMRQPEMVRMERAAWLEIAERLAEALAAPAGVTPCPRT